MPPEYHNFQADGTAAALYVFSVLLSQGIALASLVLPEYGLLEGVSIPRQSTPKTSGWQVKPQAAVESGALKLYSFLVPP
jgi:hypothetical protein